MKSVERQKNGFQTKKKYNFNEAVQVILKEVKERDYPLYASMKK